MNSQEAKSILTAYRPDRPDAGSQRVAQALEQVQKDPQLAKWFAEQQAFDALMVSAVTTIPIPSTLKASILESTPVAESKRLPDWRLRWALAASVVILASVAVLWLRRDAATMAAFRDEIVESGWSDSHHIGFASADLKQIQEWLRTEKAPGDFAIPAAVQDLRVNGCRVVDWRGQKVSLICFFNEGRHLHLFVVDEKALADVPPDNMPDFEKSSGWKTVCWSVGNKTYLLTGMNYLTFIKKSRKGGQWLLTG